MLPEDDVFIPLGRGGPRCSVFEKVIDGLEAEFAIEQGETMRCIEIIEEIAISAADQ